MFSPLRNRFGIPGVISVIALVFAMFGGAYAATNTGKATSSAKAKKGPRGPKGATGPAGPQGPAGAKGDNGAAGSNGADGKSVTAVAIAAGGECGAGVTGVKYTLNGLSTKVCNGKNGKSGQTGFTENLPQGKTETGGWAFGKLLEVPIPEGGGAVYGAEVLNVPISFSIPLAEPLSDPEEVHFINPAGKEVVGFGTEVDSTACTGSVSGPTAEPGNLCVYAEKMEKAGIASSSFIFRLDEEAAGASTAGARMWFLGAEGGANGYGTWAVTAQE
jgi:hypothetical protein